MFRSVALMALGGGLALGAWSVVPDTPRAWRAEDTGVGFVEPGAPNLIHRANFTSGAATAPAFSGSRDTSKTATCGPWEVSEAGIEAILDEMIRRGWTPPNRASALGQSQSGGQERFGVQVLALEPDAPATGPPRPAPVPTFPVETPSLPVEAVEPNQPALPAGPSQVGPPGAIEQQPQFTN